MKKKKVGIITFNQVLNYGAILQAYALKEVCSELGFESHIVNYSKGYTNDKPMPIHNFIKASNYQGNISMLIRGILSYIGDMKKWKNFCEFRNTYLSESPECFSSEDIKNLGYDVYIAGSDQIWNYNITGNQFDPVFFGEMDTEAEQIIYASSSQDTPFPFDKELKFKEMLEKMPYAVAIREKKLADYVAKLTGIRYPVVLDPTLLAGRDIFDNLADDLKEEKTYILLYQIDSNPASDISVKSLEKRFGCDVYTMTVPRLGSIHARKGTAGPKEFLSLLKNAKFIVTNSFHGIALSLLFEKQFFVYENGGVMTRIDSLLSELSLLDRKVKLVEDIDIKNMINFKPINKQLEILRVNSKKFLMDSLAGKSKD